MERNRAAKQTKLNTPLPSDPWDDPLVGSFVKTTDDEMYVIIARRQDQDIIEVEVEPLACPGRQLVIQIFANTGEIHGVFQVN